MFCGVLSDGGERKKLMFLRVVDGVGEIKQQPTLEGTF